jgi:hypothetical protein
MKAQEIIKEIFDLAMIQGRLIADSFRQKALARRITGAAPSIDLLLLERIKVKTMANYGPAESIKSPQ